jgi:hypothetical protein
MALFAMTAMLCIDGRGCGRSSPVRKRSLRTARKGHDYSAYAGRENYSRSDTHASHQSLAPARLIGKYRLRLHEEGV